MAISTDEVRAWCEQLLAPAPSFPPLESCLAEIPTLDDLADVGPGSRVLVRCDGNVTFSSNGVENSARLDSLLETLRFGKERGWVQIIHSHIGNDGWASLRLVADHLSGALGCRVHFLEDWMNDGSGEIKQQAEQEIARLAAGDVIMLENARCYSLETSLWRPRPADLMPLVGRLTRYAQTARERLARIHVNEAFAASNCDCSSALVPLAMDRVALGRHSARELSGPVLAAREAEVVVFSGAKFNKLDDLEEIVARGKVRLLVAGGLLALPLLWADARLAGRTFELGKADEVPASRYGQACRLLTTMRQRHMEVLLPVDFVLEDGSIAEQIPAGIAQRDAGPKTLERFASRLRAYAAARPAAVLFHNGVLGQFERPEFAAGTRQFLAVLADLHRGGMRIYVGGGEGGTALARWGDPAQVTHCFTAGTTILKALGVKPIPYIWALHQAATRLQRPQRDAI